MEKSEIGPEVFNQKVVELRDQMKLGGGQKRIEAQHAKGKKTARERVTELLDEGTFQEIDGFMKNRHSDFGMDKEKALGDGMVAVSARSTAVVFVFMPGFHSDGWFFRRNCRTQSCSRDGPCPRSWSSCHWYQ
jgi:acetyl-CoA carboxylase carboxyltransferase component